MIPELYQHQKDALAKSREIGDMALFFEMGTGKSRTAIEIMRDKFNTERRIMRTLILGPVAVIYNWENEIRKFSQIDPKQIYPLSGAQRASKLSKILNPNGYTLKRPVDLKTGVVIVNYEAMLSEDLFKLLQVWEPEIIVCDESHKLKNPKAKTAKKVYELASTAKYRIIMTGTPILQNSMDIFMQYKILDGGKTFGINFYSFQSKYFKDANYMWKGNKNYFPKYIPIPEMQNELSARIFSKALYITKDQCLDLPERVEQKIYVEMNPDQARLYKTMKKEFIAFLDNKENAEKPHAIVAQLAVTKALRLQQIVCGFVKDDNGVEHTFENIPRLHEVENILEQIIPMHKCILWCSFVNNYKQLADLCNKMKFKYAMITGEQSAKEKQEAIDQFENDGSCHILIANRRAGGTGINLTSASYSITYSRNFNLADELQSRDRNYRSGSERHERIVKIDLICKDTIDELCEQALANKQEIGHSILSWKDKL